MLKRFLNDESGASAVEYGLILAVLSLAIIAGIEQASNSLVNLWTDNANTFENAGK